jgi:hypothetical protein
MCRMFFSVCVVVLCSFSIWGQPQYQINVYPNQNTILFPNSTFSPVSLKLPHGTWNVSASFNNTHAGGDIDRVFLWTQTGEITTQWPRGHAIHEAIGTEITELSFPTPSGLDSIQVFLFFVDGSNLGDNYGTAVVTFQKKPVDPLENPIQVSVYPSINTLLIPTNFPNASLVTLPHGQFTVSTVFNSAHAGGDIDRVFLWAQTGETTSQWPRGHAIHEAIGTDTKILSCPTPSGIPSVQAYVFFIDGGNLSDNSGSATVAFTSQSTKIIAPPPSYVKTILSHNVPNPFSLSTSVIFNLPSQSFVTLKVFDATGREVSTLLSEELPAGNHAKLWNSSSFPNGIYYYRLQTAIFCETKRILLTR